MPIVINGDWPWLVECGALARNFRRAAKRSSSDCINVGLCHFCMNGSPGIPDADPCPTAKWISTMGSAASYFPWDEITPVTRLMPALPTCPAYIYRPDLFHNWHLGLGQCFVASSLRGHPLLGDSNQCLVFGGLIVVQGASAQLYFWRSSVFRSFYLMPSGKSNLRF